MAIPEMLEWPTDAKWLSEHRKKRFESLEDCREYLKYQFSEYMEDEKYIKTAITIWGYIYEKGYAVPLEFLERFKEKDKQRKMNIKRRRERRNRVRNEYKRWHVHFREKFSTIYTSTLIFSIRPLMHLNASSVLYLLVSISTTGSPL